MKQVWWLTLAVFWAPFCLYGSCSQSAVGNSAIDPLPESPLNKILSFPESFTIGKEEGGLLRQNRITYAGLYGVRAGRAGTPVSFIVAAFKEDLCTLSHLFPCLPRADFVLKGVNLGFPENARLKAIQGGETSHYAWIRVGIHSADEMRRFTEAIGDSALRLMVALAEKSQLETDSFIVRPPQATVENLFSQSEASPLVGLLQGGRISLDTTKKLRVAAEKARHIEFFIFKSELQKRRWLYPEQYKGDSRDIYRYFGKAGFSAKLGGIFREGMLFSVEVNDALRERELLRLLLECSELPYVTRTY